MDNNIYQLTDALILKMTDGQNTVNRKKEAEELVKKWKKTNQESLVEAMAENSEETAQEPKPDTDPVISSADATEEAVSPQNLADEPSTVLELEAAGLSADYNP